MTWMTDNLIAVLKTGHPIGPKDYKPMELTWHIVKTVGRLILHQLRPIGCPLQFALELRTSSSTCSTISTPIWTSHRALWESCLFVFYFFSAFNIIRSSLGDPSRLDYPTTGRPQYVHLLPPVLDSIVNNRGPHRGKSFNPSSSPYTQFSAAAGQRADALRGFLMSLQSWDVSERMTRKSTGLQLCYMVQAKPSST